MLIDCSGPEDEEKREETAFVRKRDMMVQNLLKRPAERTLVFCNSIPNCRRVSVCLNITTTTHALIAQSQLAGSAGVSQSRSVS